MAQGIQKHEELQVAGDIFIVACSHCSRNGILFEAVKKLKRPEDFRKHNLVGIPSRVFDIIPAPGELRWSQVRHGPCKAAISLPPHLCQSLLLPPQASISPLAPLSPRFPPSLSSLPLFLSPVWLSFAMSPWQAWKLLCLQHRVITAPYAFQALGLQTPTASTFFLL